METSTSTSGCSVDILTDDALIVIFSFLSLYERITLMRVNKRWQSILSNPQTWTHLDFWQEQKTNKNWETKENKQYRKYTFKADSKTWLFPVEEKAVLDFLTTYTCASLKSLYLHVVSAEITAHVKESYRNLETISFLSAHNPPSTAFVPGPDPWPSRYPNPCSHDLEPVVQCLSNIKVCELSLNTISCNTCIEMQQSKLLTSLRECGNLRRLIITGIEPRYLTPDSLDGLSQKIIEVNLGKLAVKRRGCRAPRGPDYSGQLCSSLQALLKIANMNTFKISVNDPFLAAYKLNLDEFLCGIADNWHELKCLCLIGFESPSAEVFSSILTGLSQLEQLEVYGSLATDVNIALIAKYLKKLISLNITVGTYTPSGVKCLCGHPSIEKLYLLQKTERKPSPEWLLAVYDVIRSLPKITYVRLMGCRLIALHAQEEIPSISPNIQMDVENIDELSHSPMRLPMD